MAEFVPLITAEEDSKTSWYTATAAGIASGLLKIPEGVVSLAAELIDLGADSKTAAEVEQFFDKINPFEEIAQERAIGKLTETLVSIGVPGTAGFKLGTKLADKALKAKRAGTYANLKNKNTMDAMLQSDKLNKAAGIKRFSAGVLGGAAGETFVADVEEIGTFGDLFDGPTALDQVEELTPQEDAVRKLMNRVKFGSESILLTPFVYGAGVSAKALATRGKELAYSNSRFERWIDKYIGSPFRPRGDLPQEIFESEMVKAGLKSRDIDASREIVNNITREVDKIFPFTQTVLDKSVKSEKEQFLKQINEYLFDGDLTDSVNPKKIDELVSNMASKNVSEQVSQNIVTSLNKARGEFTNLVGILNRNTEGVTPIKGVEELQDIFKNRIQNFTGTTYKIFEQQPKGIFKFFQRYEPTDEAYVNSINLFRRYLSKTDPARKEAFNLEGTQYFEQAKNIVDDIINQVSKVKKPGALPDIKYTDGTMMGQKTKSFEKLTGKGSKVFRELFGEIEDPRYSIFNGMTNLSSVARTANYFDDISLKNTEIQQKGGRGFFWDSEQAGKDAVNSSETGIQLVEVDKVFQQLPGAKQIVNPLSTKWTTKEIADAILLANDVPSGLAGFVRGRDAAGPTEEVASWMYRNLLLFPKGISQMAKTIFSIPTHLRNFFGGGAFAAANGVMFENPLLLKKAFLEGIDVSGLLKFGPKSPEAQKAYRELLELGVVNQQVQIGDLKALLQDIKLGEQISNTDSILRPFMSKFKKLGEAFQGKYVAEDDVWKITNYVVELDRLKAGKARQLGITKDRLKLSPEDLLNLKKEASNIVKNTVPNYAYVGSFVKTARLLPIGNFMSFPSEIIRTTTGIAEQGLKELKHSKPVVGSNVTPMVYEVGKGFVKNDNVMYRTGLRRIAGMAGTLTAVPVAVTEGAKALYDVTEDEINALRQFVPEWSKNSTLVPIRDDDGNLRYIDFSHSNAYDLIARPFNTLFNNIMEGKQDGDTLLKGFLNGVSEAGGEVMNPFISESIWTEAATDIIVRGGRTKDGKVLYTDQTPSSEKAKILFLHLGETLTPSYKQFQRVGQAALDIPTKRGEQLEIDYELAGFMGLRPIKVDPLDTMGFKISEYQNGIRNARTEFTGGYFGLLSGGKVTPNEIIKKYVASNVARFNVQKEMFKNINAAEILGVQGDALLREFRERQLSPATFSNLKNGRFEPYFPSIDIQNKFKENADKIGQSNPFIDAVSVLREIQKEMQQTPLSDSLGINIENYLFEEEPLIQTSPLPIQSMPNASILTPPQQVAGLQNNGLTPIESALLSPEEQRMRLKQRGLA
jgi:hypothetical protein